MKYLLSIAILLSLAAYAEEPKRTWTDEEVYCRMTAQEIQGDISGSLADLHSEYVVCQSTKNDCQNERRAFDREFYNVMDKSRIYLRFCTLPCSQ
jgi:hypothetical protein